MIDLTKDYHPWTAEFLNGTFLSRKTNTNLKFIEDVLSKEPLLYTFSIHLADDKIMSVRLDDGLFYIGSKIGDVKSWLHHPNHINADWYRIVYFRECEAALTAGSLIGRVSAYYLGWRVYNNGEETQRLLKILPDGQTTWL